ncbi:hypothetical protein [Bacillus sp. B1-b2]|uniref:hypothetical protein n=1 Tax=Bacillus sp. B1-b2 TaxID=2653201 RepID=UPI001261FA32|nr:hypothetical protein [Bacillus sp. B1-b2]KAB7672035.1 hypothetical protein F9279_03675 [Bacillus sp. B1-b2]
MKRIFVLVFIILGLVGCSNENIKSDSDKAESGDNLSLEEQIIHVMSENQLKDEEIIDYDIKGDFVYVIFKNNHDNGNTHNPDLVILKNNGGNLKWIAGPENRTASVDSAMIFGRDDGPSVTINIPSDYTNIKDIKVLGESAKAVTYIQRITDDFSREYKYWIAYTDEEPTHSDMEIITE